MTAELIADVWGVEMKGRGLKGLEPASGLYSYLTKKLSRIFLLVVMRVELTLHLDKDF